MFHLAPICVLGNSCFQQSSHLALLTVNCKCKRNAIWNKQNTVYLFPLLTSSDKLNRKKKWQKCITQMEERLIIFHFVLWSCSGYSWLACISVSKGASVSFCEWSAFSAYILPWIYPLVISFGDKRAQLCTSGGNMILQGIVQGGSHSILNASWQFYLFVEMGLLFCSGVCGMCVCCFPRLMSSHEEDPC